MRKIIFLLVLSIHSAFSNGGGISTEYYGVGQIKIDSTKDVSLLSEKLEINLLSSRSYFVDVKYTLKNEVTNKAIKYAFPIDFIKENVRSVIDAHDRKSILKNIQFASKINGEELQVDTIFIDRSTYSDRTRLWYITNIRLRDLDTSVLEVHYQSPTQFTEHKNNCDRENGYVNYDFSLAKYWNNSVTGNMDITIKLPKIYDEVVFFGLPDGIVLNKTDEGFRASLKNFRSTDNSQMKIMIADHRANEFLEYRNQTFDHMEVDSFEKDVSLGELFDSDIYTGVLIKDSTFTAKFQSIVAPHDVIGFKLYAVCDSNSTFMEGQGYFTTVSIRAHGKKYDFVELEDGSTGLSLIDSNYFDTLSLSLPIPGNNETTPTTPMPILVLPYEHDELQTFYLDEIELKLHGLNNSDEDVGACLSEISVLSGAGKIPQN